MFSHRVDDEVELFLLMPHHSEALFELVEANRESWGEWLGWVAGVTDVEAMRDFITRGLERFGRQESIYLGIRYKGKFVGRAAFGSIDLDYARKLDIGYAIDGAYQGKGIITRAVRAMVDYALGDMGLRKVEIVCAVENTASRAVPERLGFVKEGTIRGEYYNNGQYYDMVVYGVLADEWREIRLKAE
jgi:ribosomal-protein-serine acetyltransferase